MKEEDQNVGIRKKTHPALAGLETEGATNQAMWEASRNGKRQENGFYPRSLERNAGLDFSPVRPILGI